MAIKVKKRVPKPRFRIGVLRHPDFPGVGRSFEVHDKEGYILRETFNGVTVGGRKTSWRDLVKLRTRLESEGWREEPRAILPLPKAERPEEGNDEVADRPTVRTAPAP